MHTSDEALKRHLEDIFPKLQDQFWRLNNLYYIKDVHGNAVLFNMNEAQLKLYDGMHYLNVILKARQLGFTTFVQIYFLDCALFSSNKNFGVIAHNLDAACSLFKEKIKFAYDKLHPDLQKLRPVVTSNQTYIEFSNGSSIKVSCSTRSGTYQRLHISEFGKIAATNPSMATEIITGATNALHRGSQIIIESTAEGHSGAFCRMVNDAINFKNSGQAYTDMDWKIHFFPWYECSEYHMDDEAPNVCITAEMEAYFQSLRVPLTPGQKAWYVKKYNVQREMMKREFPSTAEEAFKASNEGAYYKKEMETIRKNGQITSVPYDARYPVRTYWDLGYGGDRMAIIFMQEIDGFYNIIDYHEAADQGWSYFANVLNAKGYGYFDHNFPHDGGNSSLQGEMTTHANAAKKLGINPINIIKRTNSVNVDIMTFCRPFLLRCRIDEKNCDPLIMHLDNYQKKPDRINGGFFEDPLHNDASHACDAVRTMAVGHKRIDNPGYIQQGKSFDYNEYRRSIYVNQPTFVDTEFDVYR